MIGFTSCSEDDIKSAGETNEITTDEDWPNEDNTGPQGALTNYSGDITTTEDGQIIENLNITGSISVKHSNVIIRNCKFESLDIKTTSPTLGENCLVHDCELKWAGRQNFTLLRCKMSSASSDLVRTSGPNVTIEDSYFIITGPREPDSHADIIQEYPTNSGSNMLARHNTFLISGEGVGCINAQAWTIENNLMAGGSYTLYTVNSIIKDNHFSTRYSPNVGEFGIYYKGAEGSTCTGNVIHETGEPIDCDQ